MRLWTLHPKYLDQQGLVGVWREGLLAQAVLSGKTKGYRNHPQLTRFKLQPDPLRAIAYYLQVVKEEADTKGYQFDASKIPVVPLQGRILTSAGQLAFEFSHLLAKLEKRSQQGYEQLKELKEVDPHPLFQIIPGGVEDWEKGNINVN